MRRRVARLGKLGQRHIHQRLPQLLARGVVQIVHGIRHQVVVYPRPGRLHRAGPKQEIQDLGRRVGRVREGPGVGVEIVWQQMPVAGLVGPIHHPGVVEIERGIDHVPHQEFPVVPELLHDGEAIAGHPAHEIVHHPVEHMAAQADGDRAAADDGRLGRGDQAVIQRVFASKDNEIRKVTAMNFSCGFLISVIVTTMGLAIFAYFHAHPEKFDASSTIDKIVPLFVVQGMPHGAIGIVIAAIFASAMATVAGSMNSVATIFTVDFYERWFPKSEDQANLRMMRLSTVGTGVAATLLALWLTTLNLKSIMVTWNIVSSLLGGGIVGIFALGMFSTRANSGGAICGAILSIVLGLYVKFFTGIHWAFLLPILIFSAMIIGYFCSFLFKKDDVDLKGLTIFHLK